MVTRAGGVPLAVVASIVAAVASVATTEGGDAVLLVADTPLGAAVSVKTRLSWRLLSKLVCVSQDGRGFRRTQMVEREGKPRLQRSALEQRIYGGGFTTARLATCEGEGGLRGARGIVGRDTKSENRTPVVPSCMGEFFGISLGISRGDVRKLCQEHGLVLGAFLAWHS